MRSIFAIIKKDVLGYFDQPAAYIFLVIFVGVGSYLFFRTAITTAEASLRPLFGVMPFMLAVLVAASTMRLVAEEQRDGTLETLLTHPIKGWAVLMAKFLAGLIFVGIAIVGTVGIPLLLQTAGNLDDGQILAQYLGTFMLTGSFVSIGLFASSLTRNQIVAFILSLFIIMILIIAGLDVVVLAIPGVWGVLVQDLSPLTHFTEIARGVVGLRDFLYFVTLISTFLAATYLTIRAKSISHRSPLYRNLQLGVGGLVIVSVLVGWFGQSISGRVDFTEESLYTLSDEAKGILGGLDDYVTIKLFASKDPPPQVSLVSRDVQDFLREVKAASNGKIQVVTRHPDADEDAVSEAEQSFVPAIEFSDQSGTELSVKVGYLGIGMTYANRQEVIPIISQTEGLEFEIVSNIVRMTREEPKTLGFLIGHGEKFLDVDFTNIRPLLELYYNVVEVAEDNSAFLILDEIDVLVVPGARNGTPEHILAQIDDWIAKGGNSLWMVDTVRVDPAQFTGIFNIGSNAGYLRRFGVQIPYDVVFDMRSNEPIGMPTAFGIIPLRYPYWARVGALEEKISGGVSSVVLPWASSIEVIEPLDETAEIETIPLLETSEFAGLDESFFDLTPETPILAQVTEEDLAKRLMAVAITGTKCPPLVEECERDTENPFRMIISTNSDWMADGMLSQFREHVPLALNWIDWLMQEDTLATLRARGRSIRPLVFTSDTHLYLVQYGNIVGVPALFIVLGLVRFVMRRRLMRKVYQREG